MLNNYYLLVLLKESRSRLSICSSPRLSRNYSSSSFVINKKKKTATFGINNNRNCLLQLQQCNKNVFLTSPTSIFSSSTRNYSSNDDSTPLSSSNPSNPPPPKLPALMEFPHIMWPKMTYAIRNWFISNFIIRAHMDKDFDIREFDRGAKQALSIVSTAIANGKFDELVGLVTTDALTQIQQNIQKFSVGQREMLAVNVEDIYFSFPYQIGIIMPDEEPKELTLADIEHKKPQKRYVEITVGFHVLRGLAEQVKSGKENRHFLDFLKQEDTKYRVMVCNYRFWRNFTEGVADSSWIVNMVSHFLPAAEVDAIKNKWNS